MKNLRIALQKSRPCKCGFKEMRYKQTCDNIEVLLGQNLVPLLAYPYPQKLIYSVWLRTIGNPAFQNFVSSKGMTLQNFLHKRDVRQSNRYRVAYSARNCQFTKLLAKYKLRNVRYSTRNSAKSSFSDVTKVQNAGLPIICLRSQTD